jgi:cytochrome c oxidase subunit II
LVDTREKYDHLLGIYLPIGITIAVLVFAAFIFLVIRYRRRPGNDGMPSQRPLSHWFDIAWAAIVAAIVGLLLYVSLSTEGDVDKVSADPGLEVDVTAFQWGWRFTYPASGVTVVGDNYNPPTLTVPTDTTVRFEVVSRDVIHSFWIPDLRFKKDAFPDRTNTFDPTFPAGTMEGRCAEFCGLRHANMLFNVQAVPPSEFESWLQLEQRKQNAHPPPPAPPPGGET